MEKIGEMHKIVLNSYHYVKRSALKEDMEDGYKVVAKRKFADHVV